MSQLIKMKLLTVDKSSKLLNPWFSYNLLSNGALIYSISIIYNISPAVEETLILVTLSLSNMQREEELDCVHQHVCPGLSSPCERTSGCRWLESGKMKIQRCNSYNLRSSMNIQIYVKHSNVENFPVMWDILTPIF